MRRRTSAGKAASYLAVPGPRWGADVGVTLVAVAGSTALGDFLRARRARLRPDQVGLPASTGRRRIPGLRREELAALAGLSIDYYIRLEQGRERNPSPPVVDGLADALQLDADERAHLLALTHHASGRTRPVGTNPDRRVRAAVRFLLERLRPCPALLLTRTSDVLAANPEGLALFDGLSGWPAPKRNTLRYVLTHPRAHDLFLDWEHAAATGVANLRSAYSADPHAADLTSIRDELNTCSQDFRRLWTRYDVRPRHGSLKAFRHPSVGDIELTHETLHLHDTGQRLSLYQPEPGSRHEQALSLLSITTQLSATDDHR